MIVFQSLETVHFPLLEPWFNDEELKKRLGGFYPVVPQLEFILQAEHHHAWVIKENEQMIAFLELEVENGGIANILFVMNPAYRGQGRCLDVLQKAKSLSIFQDLKEVHAYIEEDAMASKRCFEKAGYRYVSKEEGFEKWVKNTLNLIRSR